MKEFKIGQKVRIVDNEATMDFGLDALGFIGKVVTITRLETEADIQERHDTYGDEGHGVCAKFVRNGYDTVLIPAAACELVEDATAHAETVAALTKSGADIQQELTAEDCHMLHMAVGISGEAGELLDAVKKAVIYRKPLDRENVVEELGDLEFYMEGLRQGLGITREETIQANIAKLGKRYGEKYSDKAAQERADKA